jgi:addiction module HigA family antidote
MSASALAKNPQVPVNRISEIVRGHRGTTADMAECLTKYFDPPPEFWMDLQTAHDPSKVESILSIRQAAVEIVAVTKAKKKNIEAL